MNFLSVFFLLGDPAGAVIIINTKNCSLSIVLTATDQKPQKSLKVRDFTHRHIA